jgi:hypothetical protein
MISRRDAIAALAGMLPAEINPVHDANPKDEKLIDLLHEILAKLERLRLTSPPIGSVVAFAGEWPKDDGKTPFELNIGWLLCDGRKLKDVEDRLDEEMRKRKDANGKNLEPPEGGILAQLRAILPAKRTPDGKEQPADALPDYRGMFLRGVDDRKFLTEKEEKKNRALSGKDAGGPRLVGSEQQCATKVPKEAFIFSGIVWNPAHDGFDRLLKHDGKGTINKVDEGDPSHSEPNLLSSAPAQGLVYTPAITGGGDGETRPINVAVNYIIKFQ